MECCFSHLMSNDPNADSCVLCRRDLQMKKLLDVYVVGDNHRNNLYEERYKQLCDVDILFCNSSA